MTSEDDDDVPIRVDFRDPATARAWIEDTRIKRPYRPRFFAAFCAALAARPNLRILELGSGPGQLAREILVHCDVHTYVALDFSPAMHEIAAEHLDELARRVTFVTRDFREPAWPANLGTFDAIVTLQAAHEARHKRHLVPLIERARTHGTRARRRTALRRSLSDSRDAAASTRAGTRRSAASPRVRRLCRRPAALRGGQHGAVVRNEPCHSDLIAHGTLGPITRSQRVAEGSIAPQNAHPYALRVLTQHEAELSKVFLG